MLNVSVIQTSAIATHGVDSPYSWMKFASERMQPQKTSDYMSGKQVMFYHLPISLQLLQHIYWILFGVCEVHIFNIYCQFL